MKMLVLLQMTDGHNKVYVHVT